MNYFMLVQLEMYLERKITNIKKSESNYFGKNTLKRSKATRLQWKIHELWFKELDRDNVPSCFQETFTNSTK